MAIRSTSAELIYEAMRALGGRAFIQDVINWIRINRPQAEVKDNTISTDMSDLSVNGPPSSLYPMEKRFLWRVGRGEYELYDPRKHGNKGITLPEKTRQIVRASEHVLETYDYLGAEELLGQKELFQQVMQITQSIKEVEHDTIQEGFKQSGWLV